MAEKSLYEDLKDVLADFKKFLDDNISTLKPAVNALAALVPKIVDLIDLLIELMNQIKTEIENLDVGSIPGLGEVSEFTNKIKSFVDTSKDLLPDDAKGTADEVLEVVNVVGGLPSLDDVKAEILTLIAAIVAHLNSLKPTS